MAYSPNPTVEQYTHALFDPSFFLFPIPHPLSLPLHFRGVGCPPPFIYSPRNRTTTTHTRYKAHQDTLEMLVHLSNLDIPSAATTFPPISDKGIR